MASDTDHTENGSGAEDAPPKRPSATRVEHFTLAERSRPWQGDASGGLACVTRRMGAALHRPDPVELLEEQARRAFRSSSRSATAACSSRRSRSIAAPPT